MQKSFEEDVSDLEMPDELTTLKARADQMGLSYHPSIGVEKLRDKINAAVSAEGPVAEEEEDVPVVAAKVAAKETQNELRVRKKREASELVRIRVTCMNPMKKEYEGEIFTVSNSVVGTFKKYVPFNADDGWHVPRIIYNQLVQRQCQVFTTVKDGRGNKVRKGKLIKEFAVEVLPPLTPAELKELAQRQAMARGQ